MNLRRCLLARFSRSFGPSIAVGLTGLLAAGPARAQPGIDPALDCGMQPYDPPALCSPLQGTLGDPLTYDSPGDSVVYGPEDPPPWTPVVFDVATRTESTLAVSPGYVDWDPGYEAYSPDAPGCAPRGCTALGIQVGIIGNDDREQVTNTTEFPWRAIGMILLEFDDGVIYNGTGALVGPRHVLTAAHLMHRREAGITDPWPVAFAFIPGVKGEDLPDDAPYGAASWTKAYCWKGWTEAVNIFGQPTPDHDFDLMLIVLDKALGDTVGWFGLETGGSDVDKWRQASGYPGDKGLGEQWWSPGHVSLETKHRLYYDLDSAAGLSGAPVWYYSDDKEARLIRAVHTRSGVFDNQGVAINAGKYDTIVDWIGNLPTKPSAGTCPCGGAPVPALPPGWLAVLAVAVAGSGLLVLRRIRLA